MARVNLVRLHEDTLIAGESLFSLDWIHGINDLVYRLVTLENRYSRDIHAHVGSRP